MLSNSETGVNPGVRSNFKKSTILNELDVRKPLVVSISEKSKSVTMYNLVCSLTFLNNGLKAVSLNACPG
jgi:hypothetical protein